MFHKAIEKTNTGALISFQAARSMDSNYWSKIFIEPDFSLDKLYDKAIELEQYDNSIIALPIYGTKCSAISGEKNIPKYFLNKYLFRERLEMFSYNSQSFLYKSRSLRQSTLRKSALSFVSDRGYSGDSPILDDEDEIYLDIPCIALQKAIELLLFCSLANKMDLLLQVSDFCTREVLYKI